MKIFDYTAITKPLKKQAKNVVKVEIPKETKALLKLDVDFPDVQKVEITNQKEVIIPDVKFPDVQKVELQNPTTINFPDVQRVEVTNPQEYPTKMTVEVANFPTPILPPSLQRVEVTNPTEFKLPIVKGNSKKSQMKADEYIPVRLTDGDRFYKAIDEIWTAASKGGGGSQLMGYVVTGQKKITSTGIAVNLPSNSLKNGVIVTAKSSNTGDILIGMSNVSTTEDGTGNGYILEAGSSVSYAVTDTATIWINGNGGDIVSFSGS